MTFSRIRYIAGAMVLAAVALGCLSYYSTEPVATTVASHYIKKQRPPAKSVKTTEPAPEMIPAKPTGKRIETENTEVSKEIRNQILSGEARLESAKNRAQIRIDREIQALERAVPSLRSDQEQRVREALELNMPKITEKDGTLITTIRSPEPSLRNPEMEKVFATLDTDQQQAVNGLLEKRQRTEDEAKAIRSYAQAIETLPDLSEDKKNALHNYYLELAGQAIPTREDQQQRLAAFLSPDEIEILSDTYPVDNIRNIINSTTITDYDIRKYVND